MNLKSWLKTGTSWGRRIFDASIADMILDGAGKMLGGNIQRPKKSSDDEDGDIKPLFGLAGLTPKNERAFRRILLRQPHDVKLNVTWAILEYYIAPAKLGFIPARIANFQLDKFMLEVAEAAKDGQKSGERKIVKTVERTTATGKSTTVTTTDEDVHSSRGKEDDELLAAIAETFAIGGVRALDEFMRVNRLPHMDHEALQKTQERVGMISVFAKEALTELLPTIKSLSNKTETRFNTARAVLQERHDARKEKHKSRSWLGRLLNNI